MRRAAVLLVAVVYAVATACGSAPGTVGRTGVDGLTIPTPSLDPADFADRIDNPWLPLIPGSEWTYDTGQSGRTLTLRVASGTETVAGIEAAVVEETTRGSGGLTKRRTFFYAQDLDGNVWLLGEGGRWRAGEAGAEAGVAMLAEPRIGDGYLQQRAPGVVETRATILTVEPAEIVVVEEENLLRPGATSTREYRSGTGLVKVDSPVGTLTLQGHRPG